LRALVTPAFKIDPAAMIKAFLTILLSSLINPAPARITGVPIMTYVSEFVINRKYLSELRISPELIDLSNLISIFCEKTPAGIRKNKNNRTFLFNPDHFILTLTSISLIILSRS
jgi:energy-coupling factor transporter transmembrane protein EcfT